MRSRSSKAYAVEAGWRARAPRRAATISARIDSAISSGVIAPRSRPAGERRRASRSAATPRCASVALSASALRRHHDEALSGLLDRQRITLDAAVGLGERRLVGRRRADGYGESDAPAE